MYIIRSLDLLVFVEMSRVSVLAPKQPYRSGANCPTTYFNYILKQKVCYKLLQYKKNKPISSGIVVLGDWRRNYRRSKYTPNMYGRFPCSKCGSTYKQKTHLIRHMNFECGIEPQFSCDVCGKRFKQKSNCRSHMKAVHSQAGYQLDFP